jgi:hypothetical protein
MALCSSRRNLLICLCTPACELDMLVLHKVALVSLDRSGFNTAMETPPSPLRLCGGLAKGCCNGGGVDRGKKERGRGMAWTLERGRTRHDGLDDQGMRRCCNSGTASLLSRRGRCESHRRPCFLRVETFVFLRPLVGRALISVLICVSIRIVFLTCSVPVRLTLSLQAVVVYVGAGIKQLKSN